MSNELKARFIADYKDAFQRTDEFEFKLTKANNTFNNLGKAPIGKNFADALKPAENALDSLQKKAESSFQKPTISRYWEAEENKVVGSVKAIENALSKPLTPSGAAPLKTNLPSTVKTIVDKQSITDLDNLKKRVDDARRSVADLSKIGEAQKSFADISRQRISSGNIGVFTKEIVVAHERARQLAGDIANIKAEIANPDRKSTIKFLTEELKAAEVESGRLQRRLSTLQSSNAASINGLNKGGKKRGLTDFDRSLLEITDDFAPTGFNRPFNAVGREILAVNAISLTTLATFGAIAATAYLIVDASKKNREEAEKRLKYETAISAAGNKQAILQKTASRDFDFNRRQQQSERDFSRFLPTASVEDLEKRRSNLEKLRSLDPKGTNAENFERQIFAIDAQIDNFYRDRQLRRDKEIQNRQSFIDAQRQQNAQEIELSLNYSKAVAASNFGGVKLLQENAQLEIQALRRQIQNNNNSAGDSLLNLTSSDFDNQKGRQIRQQRDLENARLQSQIATLQITSQKAIADEIKNTEQRIKELNKSYNETFSNLSQKLNSQNPFVAVFAEARSDVEKLKESIRGLPENLQQAAIKMQQTINSNRLFEARLDNALAVEDLQDTSARFRKLPKPTRELFDNAFKDFVEKKAEEIKTVFNQIRDETGKPVGISQSQINPFIRFNAITGADGKLGGFTQTDIRNNPFTAFDRLANGSTLRRERNFNDLTDKEKRDLIDRFSVQSDDQISAKQRLQRQFDIINTKIATPAERSIADQKILGIAGTLDPTKLDRDQREQIAAAAERRAAERAKYENANLEIQRVIAAQTAAIVANTANLRGIANEKGIEGLNDYIKISLEDKRSTGSLGTQTNVALEHSIREGFDNSYGGRSR